MTQAQFVPLSFLEYPEDEMAQRASDFFVEMKRRRTVRDYSEQRVPQDIIEMCVRTAGTAPSGANQQPWHFVVLQSMRLKHECR